MNECCNIRTSLRFLFDLHGVLENKPFLYRPFLKSLRCTGHKVFIASGAMPDRLIKELTELGYKRGLHYDDAISVPDFLMNLGVPFTFDYKNEPWTDDETWWASKGMICDEYKIDMMFDDSEQYKSRIYSNTEFALLR